MAKTHVRSEDDPQKTRCGNWIDLDKDTCYSVPPELVISRQSLKYKSAAKKDLCKRCLRKAC